MPIVRPRLTDYYSIGVTQEGLDFAIPFLDEDLPLHVDPFLLWRSPSLQDNALHTAVINSFNHLGHLNRTDPERAISILVRLSECDEIGLGSSHTRKGKRFGRQTAKEILGLFELVPDYNRYGFRHFEEIQFFVEGIAKDRISDICCSFIKSFLIDYTIQQCTTCRIPLVTVTTEVYDYRNNRLTSEDVQLPVNPETGLGIILVPKHWLRYTPWLNFDEYYVKFAGDQQSEDPVQRRRQILTYNRTNYDSVKTYVVTKEKSRDDCVNDPLFKQIPLTSARAALRAIRQLPTGITDSNDKKYEREASRLLASLCYPLLDFAQVQARTEDGVLIRDLIFYNNRGHQLLQDLWDTYSSKQIVFELKNVKEIQRDHINQLNRYLTDTFGRFGILMTRNPLKPPMMKNTTQLWSGQRKCIIALTDEDLDLMVSVYESKQRDPIDVLKKKYIEFTRACPS
jgi:hypothetical protein